MSKFLHLVLFCVLYGVAAFIVTFIVRGAFDLFSGTVNTTALSQTAFVVGLLAAGATFIKNLGKL